MKPITAEMIRALTPIVLGVSGTAIGLFVVLSKDVTGEKATAAFGLAGTAIAGAAGLAQTGKSESEVSVNKLSGNVSSHSAS